MNNYDDQPLYDQIVAKLQDHIALHMQSGGKLPAERRIAEYYHVSRSTIRQALDELESMGYICRRENGVYVSDMNRPALDFNNTYSFAKQVQHEDAVPHVQVVYFHHILANRSLARQLAVEIGTPLYKIKRIRYANNCPLIVERNFLISELLPDLTSALIHDVSLYHMMQAHYGIHIANVDEKLSACLVRNDNAHDLKVNNHTAALLFLRTATDTQGRIVEFTNGIARADRFVLNIHHSKYDY